MRRNWLAILGTLFLSWGISTVHAQQDGGAAPPGPIPPNPGQIVPSPGPIPPNAGLAPPGQIVPSPGPITQPPAAVTDVPVQTPQLSVAPPIGTVAPPSGAANLAPSSMGGCNSTGCNNNGCNSSSCCLLNIFNWTGGLGCSDTPLGVTVGGGAYYLLPYYSSNPAYFTKTGTTTMQHNFGSDGGFGGTGFVNVALGQDWTLKFRYWEINIDNSTSGGVGGATVSNAGGFGTGAASSAGATANASNNLNINFYNLDLARKWTIGAGSWMEVSGGLAFVHMTQAYSFAVADPVLGGSLSNANHNFTGIGPTVAFEGHYKLGCSGFGLYGSARASLLFGTSDQNYYATTPAATAIGTSSSTAILPVGELELGVEWAKTFGRFTLSAQLGFVGQIWVNGGAAAEGSNLYGSNVGGQMNSPANFGFIGGVARGGITF